MADCILIPLPTVGVLALTREHFEMALAEGVRLAGTVNTSPSPPCPSAEALLDADQAGAQSGITSRWLEDSARAGIVPTTSLGVSCVFASVKSRCTAEL
jgi:hypothetical protein